MKNNYVRSNFFQWRNRGRGKSPSKWKEMVEKWNFLQKNKIKRSSIRKILEVEVHSKVENFGTWLNSCKINFTTADLENLRILNFRFFFSVSKNCFNNLLQNLFFQFEKSSKWKSNGNMLVRNRNISEIETQLLIKVEYSLQ